MDLALCCVSCRTPMNGVIGEWYTRQKHLICFDPSDSMISQEHLLSIWCSLQEDSLVGDFVCKCKEMGMFGGRPPLGGHKTIQHNSCLWFILFSYPQACFLCCFRYDKSSNGDRAELSAAWICQDCSSQRQLTCVSELAIFSANSFLSDIAALYSWLHVFQAGFLGCALVWTSEHDLSCNIALGKVFLTWGVYDPSEAFGFWFLNVCCKVRSLFLTAY